MAEQYRRPIFRPSIVPVEPKLVRWTENGQGRKNDRREKIMGVISTLRGKEQLPVASRSTLKKNSHHQSAIQPGEVLSESRKGQEPSKKPPFIVPGVIRHNDMFLLRGNCMLKTVSKSSTSFQAHSLQKVSSTLPYLRSKHVNVVTNSAESTKKQTSLKTTYSESFAPKGLGFVPPTRKKLDIFGFFIL